ncbi:hypothetical protein L7F22_022739 [Adiantum nelumboides]|nr:hypothetical protein [Adiantum nelumboides]
MLHEIFGSSSVCEDHDDDIEMEESGNVLQADLELSDREFMKCLWCEKYQQKGPWGKGKGCKTIPISAIRKHKRSPEHRFAQLKTLHEGGIKVEEHMQVLGSKIQRRVITCMKLMYFVAREDLACKKYKKLCDLAYALDVESMPVRNDYSSYTNVMAGKDFAFCISEYVHVMQMKEVKQGPFYSLMIDESTDRSVEKHMTVYISFLSGAGLGVCKTQFARLVIVADGTAQTKYDALKKVLVEIGLDVHHMVGIATDGDSSMFGCHDGLVAKLRREVLHLISTHYIAHREALAILDATKCFPCLSYIDKIANKVYSWIHSSSLRHSGFQHLLKEMNVHVLEVLQIHDIRWLSCGKVMERLVALMPAILTFWNEGAPAWYKKLCIYKVLFIIHLLADVLYDLNVLSKHFQEEEVDIACISAYIEVTMSSLRRKFLEEDFGKSTKYLKQFMTDVETGSWIYTNESGEVYIHELEYAKIPGKDKRGMFIDCGDGDVESCKQLARSFVQTLIDCLNERFPDVYFLNATKLFSPQFYPKDAKRSKCSEEREKKANDWLNRLLEKDFWFETAELVSFIVQDRLLLFGSGSGLVSSVTGLVFVSGLDSADLVHCGLDSADLVHWLVSGQDWLVSSFWFWTGYWTAQAVTIEDEYEEQENARRVVDKSGPSTRTISGPHMIEESTGSVNPWSGCLRDKKQDERGKKKMFEESSGDESFDEEHGLPHLRTPGSKHAEKYVPPYARVEEKSAPQLRR